MKAVEELAQLTNTNQTQTEKDDLIKIQMLDTPFWIVGHKGKEIHIIMGKYRITNEPLEIFDDDTEEDILHEAQDWLKYNHYNAILSMILIAITEQQNITTQKTKDATN